MDQKTLKDVLHYDQETGVFTWKVSQSNRISKDSIAGTVNPRGYLMIGIFGKIYRAHRLAWLYEFGELPNGSIDHINHNKLDNRLSNLRVVSNDENHKNMKLYENNSSGCAGVTWSKAARKWRVDINVGGTKHYLGLFVTKDEAILVRKKAEVVFGFHNNHGKRMEAQNDNASFASVVEAT